MSRNTGLLLFFSGMVALFAFVVYRSGDGSTTVYLSGPTQLPWQQTPPATQSLVVFVATQVPTPEPTPRSTNTPAPFQTYTPTVPTCGTEAPGTYCIAMTATPIETAVALCPVRIGGCWWPTPTGTSEPTTPTRGMR